MWRTVSRAGEKRRLRQFPSPLPVSPFRRNYLQALEQINKHLEHEPQEACWEGSLFGAEVLASWDYQPLQTAADEDATDADPAFGPAPTFRL